VKPHTITQTPHPEGVVVRVALNDPCKASTGVLTALEMVMPAEWLSESGWPSTFQMIRHQFGDHDVYKGTLS
jgi:hypothetical protein